MSDVFTKRAAQKKLGTVVRASKDLWDAHDEAGMEAAHGQSYQADHREGIAGFDTMQVFGMVKMKSSITL